MPSIPKHIRVFSLFTAAYFLFCFYRLANAVIARELLLGAAELGLMTSLFFGTFALVQMPLGVAAFNVNAAGHYPPQAHQAALLFTAVGSLLSLIWYLPLARQE